MIERRTPVSAMRATGIPNNEYEIAKATEFFFHHKDVFRVVTLGAFLDELGRVS